MSTQTAAIIGLLIIIGVWLWGKIGKSGMSMLAIVLIAASIVGFVFVHSFTAFSSTTLVATVQASPIANQPHEMAVHVVLYNSDSTVKSDEMYELNGDRWEINSDIVSFSPWMNFLGVSNGFSLSRLTSQYDDGNAHTVQPIALGSDGPVVPIPLIERSHYRNGVIMPDDGVKYRVYCTIQGDMYAVHA